jgi:hypothetical protein
MAADEFKLNGIESLANQGWRLEAHVADAEEGSEMEETITKYAFPTVAKLLDKNDPEAPLDPKALAASMKADLIATEWRRTNRRKRTR